MPRPTLPRRSPRYLHAGGRCVATLQATFAALAGGGQAALDRGGDGAHSYSMRNYSAAEWGGLMRQFNCTNLNGPCPTTLQPFAPHHARLAELPVGVSFALQGPPLAGSTLRSTSPMSASAGWLELPTHGWLELPTQHSH